MDRKDRIAAFDAWAAQIPTKQPGDDWPLDPLMRENAERCRAILRHVGYEDVEGVDLEILAAGGSREGSAAWIAWHWLREYRAFRHCRERIAAGDAGALGLMVLAVHEMGRLEGEMHHRPGAEPSTKRARESLMLSGRANALALKAAGEHTARLHADLRQRRLARMAELVPRVGVENAARDCEAEGLGPWQGIKKQWNRHREKNRDT